MPCTACTACSPGAWMLSEEGRGSPSSSRLPQPASQPPCATPPAPSIPRCPSWPPAQPCCYGPKTSLVPLPSQLHVPPLGARGHSQHPPTPNPLPASYIPGHQDAEHGQLISPRAVLLLSPCRLPVSPKRSTRHRLPSGPRQRWTQVGSQVGSPSGDSTASGTEAGSRKHSGAGHAEAVSPREIPCCQGQAGACPAPAQPLAHGSPSSTGITALPHAAASRRWPSRLRTALRALRRAFSCRCVSGQ